MSMEQFNPKPLTIDKAYSSYTLNYATYIPSKDIKYRKRQNNGFNTLDLIFLYKEIRCEAKLSNPVV